MVQKLACKASVDILSVKVKYLKCVTTLKIPLGGAGELVWIYTKTKRNIKY